MERTLSGILSGNSWRKTRLPVPRKGGLSYRRFWDDPHCDSSILYQLRCEGYRLLREKTSNRSF